MIYIILFIIGIAVLMWWFCASIREIRMVEPPTLGEPHIWSRLTSRLASRGLLDDARWQISEISAFKIESES